MTWFAVDDSFHGHPKVADLEDGKHFATALALWTLAGSWCAHHLTNGRVPTAQLRKLVPFPATGPAAELVRVGLWEEVVGGFQFRDWADYQPTKDEVEEKRAKGAARTRKSRNRAKRLNIEAAGNAVTPSVTDDVSNASVTLPRPDPTRPHLTSFECGSPDGDPAPSAQEQELDDDPPPQPYVEAPPLRSIEGGKADSGAVAGAGSALTPHQLATAHGLIVAAFRRRWEGHRAQLWVGVQGHPAHPAARWLAAQAERDRRPAAEIVEEIADAWFADAYVRERKWPWRLFAKQFSEFYRRPSGNGLDEPREYTNDLSGLDRFTKGTTP